MWHEKLPWHRPNLRPAAAPGGVHGPGSAARAGVGDWFKSQRWENHGDIASRGFVGRCTYVNIYKHVYKYVHIYHIISYCIMSNVNFEVSEPRFVVFEAEHLRFPTATFHPIAPVAGGWTKTYQNNRRKFRSQTSDNMDRWKSRGGKNQRGEEKK